MKIKTCLQGEMLGTTSNCFEFTARCLETSTVYKINSSRIEKIIRQIPEDLEKFQMVKDHLYGKGITRVFNQRCIICQRFTHCEFKCP